MVFVFKEWDKQDHDSLESRRLKAQPLLELGSEEGIQDNIAQAFLFLPQLKDLPISLWNEITQMWLEMPSDQFNLNEGRFFDEMKKKIELQTHPIPGKRDACPIESIFQSASNLTDSHLMGRNRKSLNIKASSWSKNDEEERE